MTKRQVLAAKGRTKRQAARRYLGPLRNQIIKPATLQRYMKAVCGFYDWMTRCRKLMPARKEQIDTILCGFIGNAWESGESRSMVGDVLSGLQHKIPVLKRQVPGAWRLLGAWQGCELPARAPPLTEDLVWALMGFFFASRQDDMAIITGVMFHCILRTVEGTTLTKADIALGRAGKSGTVNLGWTKSAQRTGAREAVTITDPLIIRLLQAYLDGLEPEDRLMQRPDREYRSLFAAALSHLGLREWEFKPYSLRRGGATHLFRMGNQLSATKVRGRWSNSRTARIYINEAMAELAGIVNDTQEMRHLRSYSANARSFAKTGKRMGHVVRTT